MDEKSYWDAKGCLIYKRAMTSGDQIRKAREAKGLSQADLARAVGISQPAINKIEKGGIVKSKYIPDILRALNIAATPSFVPMVGYVSAGSTAIHFADGQGPYDMVIGPDDSTTATVAVEIRGESLGAIFHHWLVFYDDRREAPSADMLNRLCVVGCADGRVMVKQLRQGQMPGRYHLFSNTEPPIYDAELEWAAEVKFMRPK